MSVIAAGRGVTAANGEPPVRGRRDNRLMSHGRALHHPPVVLLLGVGRRLLVHAGVDEEARVTSLLGIPVLQRGGRIVARPSRGRRRVRVRVGTRHAHVVAPGQWRLERVRVLLRVR